MIYYFKEKKKHDQTKHYIETHTEYHCVRQLGEGAYGVTYLLQHKSKNEQVVLKRLKSKHNLKQGRMRFFKEMNYLMELTDLPIPRLLQTGSIEHTPFYIMSYASGETFEHAIFANNQKFSIEETLYFTNSLLEIIQKMHAANVVHRDLRIPNIIVKNEELTIIDFGLATTIVENFSLQQLSNPKKAAHPISDLYALGHFMLFLLYSHYEPTSKKRSSWQEELALPPQLQFFLERLLTIEQPFENANQASEGLTQLAIQLNLTFKVNKFVAE